MVYFLIFVAVTLTAGVGSWFTFQGLNGWYGSLAIPSWAPPASAISTIWTILYVCIATSISLVWTTLRPTKNQWPLVTLFAANLILNFGWNFLFFVTHLLGVAFIEMLVLEVTILALIWILWPMSRLAAYLMMPYALWVILAAYLNYTIFRLN